MEDYSRAAAFVDLDAIYENGKALKARIRPGTKFCAVLKTDGYGHGAVPVAKRLSGLADFFASATIEEAFNLRKHGITEPILALGHTQATALPRAVREEIRLTVYDLDMAEQVSEEACRLGKQAFLHMKLETGMNRLGFFPGEEAFQAAARINGLPGICLEGLFSHFARADETDKTSAEKQYRVFSEFAEELSRRGIGIPLKHMGNSAAIIDLPQYQVDMVRAGIALYGMYPSEEVDKKQVTLRPALRLVARVIFVKTIEEGEAVGYGGTFVAKRKTRLATISIGYGDGYPRNLSGKGYVLLHGVRVPIAGKVCMDQLMADVTDIDGVKAGDEAVLIGEDQGERMTVEELSDLSGTFNYEFVSGLGKRIPRIYKSGGRIVGQKDYFDDEYQVELP